MTHYMVLNSYLVVKWRILAGTDAGGTVECSGGRS